MTSQYTRHVKNKCSIPDRTEQKEVLTLYSLRAFFITSLEHKNVNSAITRCLVGHSLNQDITQKHYTGRNLPLDLAAEYIERVVID